jgi:multidrug efflux pump subunit AcrB
LLHRFVDRFQPWWPGRFGACSLIYIEFVKVKMLPFDNKSEFQVIVDMPEGTTLEETARVTRELADAVLTEPTVTHLQTYVGTASPYNFNGLVRHYYLRGANVADIQVNLLGRGADLQPRIAKRVNRAPAGCGGTTAPRISGGSPPGPPVLQTLVAESVHARGILARQGQEISRENGIVDVTGTWRTISRNAGR